MGCYVTLALNFTALPHSPFNMFLTQFSSHVIWKPLCVSNTRETRLNKATAYAFPSSRVKGTSFTSISSSCTSKCSITQDLHSSRLIQVPCRNSPVQVSFLSNKVYCSRTLSGYWVGPDSEDGWGFVQALVDEII